MISEAIKEFDDSKAYNPPHRSRRGRQIARKEKLAEAKRKAKNGEAVRWKRRRNPGRFDRQRQSRH